MKRRELLKASAAVGLGLWGVAAPVGGPPTTPRIVFLPAVDCMVRSNSVATEPATGTGAVTVTVTALDKKPTLVAMTWYRAVTGGMKIV